MKYLILIIGLFSLNSITAQHSFPDQCIGIWEGQMQIYANGHLKDSIPVKLTVEPTTKDSVFIWRTSYLSETHPMVKDYTMIVVSDTLLYLDEGNDVILKQYVFGDKLFSHFTVNDIFLTSSYTLNGDQLYFEITSATLIQAANSEVQSYQVNYLQKVLFKRQTNTHEH